MSYKNPIATISFGVLASCLLVGQAPAQTPSITNYKFVAEERVTRTQFNVIYSADLVNPGPAIASAVATLSTSVPNITVVPASRTLSFGPVPANGQVASTNTFTILVDRSVPFSFSDLIWSIQTNAPLPPVANAGPNQTAAVGSTVMLNGSGSTNPSGIGTLTYSWAFTSRPAGSNATLSNPTSVTPTFIIDVPGNYVIALTVSNGTASSTASVTVSTVNTRPVANAGPNQTVNIGTTVTLNGSGSSDVDGNSLTFSWTLVEKPTGSVSVLSGANTITPTFMPDRRGTYRAQLIVNDGTENSLPAEVVITVQGNTPPVANAGPDQSNVNVNALVQVNGSGSTDVDGDPLTYRWSLITLPTGSTAVLSSTTIPNPTFTADRAGTYVAQLIVNDGIVDSAADTVTITTNAPGAPTANAGPNQTVARNSVVTLNGSGTDPQGLPLTFQWALITRPAGSAAVLSSTTIPNPTFTADLPGSYVAQLIVNNGSLNSAPATVTITTSNTAPVANAGANQNVTVGATVSLNGSGSSDADNDPLTYAWSFSSRPAGSVATLFGANTVAANFVADVAGTYVVQLIVNDGFVNSNPVTVMITAAGPSTITLTPNPLNLTNAPGTLTVTLSAPAGSGGQVVNLTSSNTAVATVQNSVTIAEGSTGANITVTPVAVGTSTITATASSFTSGTTTVNVGAAPTISFTPTSLTITGTGTQNLTLNLSVPAPSGGLTINLSSDNTVVATVPAAATFAAGATTATVPVTGVSPGSTVIRASAPGIAETTANVTVASPGSITLASGVTVGVGLSAPISVTLSTPAPAGGVTVTLTSTDPSRATVTSSVVIPAGATTPTTQPEVAGVGLGSVNITATAPGYTPATQAVQVNGTPVFTPNTLTITGTTTQNLTLTLPAPAPAGGLTVNLSSDNVGVATVPATAAFAAGATTANVPVTGVAPGSTVIRASGPNIVEATASVTVANPGTITIPTGLNVGLGLSVPFPVTLSTPAPAGGVTVTLTSGDPSKVTVTSSVVIPAGATTPTTQPQVTGVGLGSANITATAPGYTPASQAVQVNATVVFSPANLAITGTATANLTLTLSAPAPVGGVTINVSSDNPGVATVPATVAFAEGATTATVPVTGVGAGSTAIRASAPNVAEATANVTVAQGSITLPSGLTLQLGASAPFPLVLSAPAPAGGLTVTLTSSDTSVVTVTSAVVVPAGATTPATQPQVASVGAGTASITASAPGYAPASQAVNVVVSGPRITVGNASVGQNLQVPVLIQFPIPTPAGNTNLTVTSGDPTRLLVAARETFTGSGSIDLAIPEGVTSVTVYVQALAGSGTVALNASAPNYAPGSGTVTLTPSGFVFVGPNGPVANFSTDQGIDTPIPISAARLDSSLNFVAIQQVRAGLSVTVNSSSSNPAVGTITPVTFTGPADTMQARFTAVGPGSTTLTTGTPAGFSTPNQNGSVTVQVNPTSLSIDQTSVIIGQNLQTDARVVLTGVAPSGGLNVTIMSNDASRLLLSTDPTAAGFASISFLVPAGNRATPTFYVQALAGSGNATYTASAPGFGSATQSVTLAPSGFVISGPFGIGNPFFTTTGAADSNITVFAGVLNASLNFVTPQALRGGFSASVPVTSSNTAAGTILTSPVTVAGGSSSGVTRFHPVSSGSTTLTAGVPAEFSTPANARSLTVTVSTPGIAISDGFTIGQNLQTVGLLILGQPAPAGGLAVTLTSADPTRLLLSSSATTAGSGTLTVTVPEGSSNGEYFMQALGNSGTVNYTASAPGFNSRTATITLTPSGLAIISGNLSTTLNSPPTPLTIITAQVDPSTNAAIGQQPLRGGFSVSVSLTNSNPGVGSVQTPILIPGGSDTAVSNFTPAAIGETIIALQQPANFGLSNRTIVTARVNP